MLRPHFRSSLSAAISFGQKPLQHPDEIPRIEGLGEEMTAKRPVAPRCLLAVEAGYDYPGGQTAVVRLPQTVEDSSATVIRELKVKDHRVRRLLLKDLQGLSASDCLNDIEAGGMQGDTEHPCHSGAVLYEEDLGTRAPGL